MKVKKKLIEVALPLEAINKASAREKSIRHGHPSTLHLWWARRPLAAARAVIFAQVVDDPAANPDLFPTENAQNKERQRLFKIIEKLVQWENTNNEAVLQEARDEIWASWRRACAENADDPRAQEMFDRNKLPGFHDPFAGGGALPLEAQRLGLEAYATDLNPVAVLINKAMIEIPPKFSARPPVNPISRADHASGGSWKCAAGLAQDVRHYGEWMRNEAKKRIGHLYPKIEITDAMAKQRPDLKPLIGQQLTVIAWLWARTVRSPNPAYSHVEVPLATTFFLSTKPDQEAWVEPVIENGSYRFSVRLGKPKNAELTKAGTKLARGPNFKCLMSDTPIAGDYIKAEGKAARIGARLMAIVAEGERGRVYLSPMPEHEALAKEAKPNWKPEIAISGSTQYLGVKPYGMDRFDQLFTDRQLAAISTFSDLVLEAIDNVYADAVAIGLTDDGTPLRDGGTGAKAYAEAVGVYLAFATDKAAEGSTVICTWSALPTKLHVVSTFGRQALPMTWDYAEANVFADSSGNIIRMCELIAEVIERQGVAGVEPGHAAQVDATTLDLSIPRIWSTDPPYYDNVPYADLSDFFYVWLRRALRSIFPDIFTTVAVPKAQELVAFAYRHPGGKEGAEGFFLEGMSKAMERLATHTHPAFPVTIYYAFKQSESEAEAGTASTGWDTFLEAVIRAGLAVSGTWPMRTERGGGFRNADRSSLASSIILVCRPRPLNAPTATRREFVATLKRELPQAFRHLQAGNIAPVDLAQAAIGPGMSVFTRFSRVLDASGEPMAVREALALINQVLDEALAEQEGDFDGDSRWALAWFEQHGFSNGEYGVAETLSKAKNTSVAGLEEAGILKLGRGNVRLLKPEELPADWDPTTDARLTAWESVHHLIRALNTGELAAASLVAKLGSQAEIARELAYRLYLLCERKKRAAEALAYNALVLSWPEIVRLASAGRQANESAPQPELFEKE